MQPLERAAPEFQPALLSKVETIVICALAGSIGGRRARQMSLSEVSHHEASHAVVGASLGRNPAHLSIVPDTSARCGPHGRTYSLGRCMYEDVSRAAAECAPRQIHCTDIQTAARFALLLASPMTWKGALQQVRIYRARAQAIISTEWPRIADLAAELERNRELDQKQIAAIVGPANSGQWWEGWGDEIAPRK